MTTPDGRLTQAFVRNCAPNELTVLSWSRVGLGEETVAKAWTRTRTGLCVAALVLPRNALPEPPVRFETAPMGDYVARGGPPIIRSDWNVYLFENSLIYMKEQCSPDDAEPTFFAHLYPVDVNDLPGHRKQYGFDNLDFAFRDHRLSEGGACIARRELPDYAIAAIRTGQFVPGEGRIWEGSFDVVEPADDGKATQ